VLLRQRQEVQALLRQGGAGVSQGEGLGRGARLGSLCLSLALDLGLLCLSPLLLIAALWLSRGFTRPKWRRGILGKLGVGLPLRKGKRPALWVHAVSVGEVITAAPLVDELRRRFPECEVWLSVSTFTGYEVAHKKLADLRVFYFPFDLSFIVSRFFRRLQPQAVILVELELWPNFLLVARRSNVPVVVANARITERSARRYALGRSATRCLFNLPSSFGAQNEVYRDRLLRLGVEPGRIEVLGNLKHDRGPAVLPEKSLALRADLGWGHAGSLVIAGGSTHPGEETALLRAHEALKDRSPAPYLILVPRHVERLSDAELTSWGSRDLLLRWSALRGQARPLDPPREPFVLVVDTVGELELFYALADIVFVGGSLIPHGGHNLFEPARYGRPIIFGPHVHNFRDEADLLLRAGGAVRLAGAGELLPALRRLIGDAPERERLASRALQVTRGMQGATEGHLAWIERHLRLYLTPVAG